MWYEYKPVITICDLLSAGACIDGIIEAVEEMESSEMIGYPVSLDVRDEHDFDDGGWIDKASNRNGCGAGRYGNAHYKMGTRGHGYGEMGAHGYGDGDLGFRMEQGWPVLENCTWDAWDHFGPDDSYGFGFSDGQGNLDLFGDEYD